MDDRTRSALEGSIHKWEAIVSGEGSDEGTTNCPLCHLFHDCGVCEGCPVSTRTGAGECDSSPYRAWAEAARDLLGPRHACVGGHHATTEELVALAQAELDFLKSLQEAPDAAP